MNVDGATCRPMKEDTGKINGAAKVGRKGYPATSGFEKKSSVQDKCGDDMWWSYLYVHRSRVTQITEFLKTEFEVFVHTQITYCKNKKSGDTQKKVKPTISGLVFVRGEVDDIQQKLKKFSLPYHLCKDCSTGKVARIPADQMHTFMCISKARPDDVRFLLRPLQYYANNNVLLRITSGDFAGLEGYIVRIDRDRKLVMNIGGMTVAIGGVHKCKFAKVADDEQANNRRAVAEESDAALLRGLNFEEVDAEISKSEMAKMRGLTDAEARIDRFFHPVHTSQDDSVQGGNIEFVTEKILANHKDGVIDESETLNQMMFVVEEMGYYYSATNASGTPLPAVKKAGFAVRQEIERLLANPKLDDALADCAKAEYEKLMIDCGDLLGNGEKGVK